MTTPRTVLGGLLLAAGAGVLASVGVASASTLPVDGGVLQHWELPVHLQTAAEPDAVATEDAPSIVESDDLASPVPAGHGLGVTPAEATTPAVPARDEVTPTGATPGDDATPTAATPTETPEPPDDAAVTEAP